MPPITAPIRVAVTSEAPWAGGQMQAAAMSPQHEAQDQQVEAVHRVADGGAGEGLPAFLRDDAVVAGAERCGS